MIGNFSAASALPSSKHGAATFTTMNLAQTRSSSANTIVWAQESSPGLHISANRTFGHKHRHQNACSSGMRVIIMLRGELSLGFDQQRHEIGNDRSSAPEILLVNLREDGEFARLDSRGAEESKVCLSLSHDWLQQHGLEQALHGSRLGQLLGEHLAHARLQANGRIRQLALQLLEQRSELPALQALQRDSLALCLLSELFGTLEQARSDNHAPLAANPRLQRLCELIRDDHQRDWNMAELASEACMSSSTLQRHFRRAYGCSVMDFIRKARLEHARQQLLSSDASITHIALDAGYNSAANFATAFRRQFGHPPSQLRP